MALTEAQQRAGYVGWVEFIRDGGSTTHVAYLYEHGAPYFPESDLGLTDWDLRAAEAAGRLWPLVRGSWTPEDRQ